MGLFSSSSSRSAKITKIRTTTKTRMRDIGLTGKQAVNMAAVLSTSALEQSRITANSLSTLMQTVGKTSQQLVGGASNLVQAQTKLLDKESGIVGSDSNMTMLIAMGAIGAVVVLPMILRK